MQLCCREDREHDTIKIPNFGERAVQTDVDAVLASTSGSDGARAKSNERPKFPHVCMDLPLPDGAVHFDVEISKTADQPLGMILDGRFTLMGVEGGAAQEYQNFAAQDKLLQTNDWIAAVNGVAGSRDRLMEAIKDNDPVVLSIVRVRPIELIVSQSFKRSGMDFVYHSFAHCDRVLNSFDILSIGEGAFMEYNRLAPPHRRLELDDRVVSVNGKRGSADMLLESIRSNRGDLKIEILRYPATCRWYH